MQKTSKRVSLARTISMMVLAMVVVCSAVIGLISYLIYRQDSVDLSAERAAGIAKTFAATVDGDELAVSVEPAEKTPYWHVVKAAADKTRDDTGVMYFYIISHVEGGNAVYLIDALGEESSDLGDVEAVGNFADELFESLDTGAPTITGIYDSGDYGYLVSGFAPVLDSAGRVVCVVGVDIGMDDALHSSNVFGLEIIAIVAGFSILFGLVTMWYIGRKIGRPLTALAKAADRIALGDTEIELSIHSNDEIGLLADAFRNMNESSHRQMDVLETIADRDLSADIAPRSDRDAMTFSIRRLTGTLNDMFHEIQGSTNQVSAGSKQIADGAQLLAQGSAEQGVAVERLSGAISDMALKTKANAERAEKAAGLAGTIKGNAEKGSGQMERMMQAVKEINEASQSIGKVIKVIDDIAFQTNILALNAAVEAARAGQHGKGFAVVADEVRNLAAKSAAAAKDTGALISNSIEKAELGAGIARETSRSLDEIVAGIVESAQIVQEIAESSVEQSDAIVGINKGIQQVAQVVQQNSATAEQSAAASEEMSGQSDLLNQMVSQFKLSHETGMRL